MPDKSDAVQLSGAGITARVEGNHILIIYVIISMGIVIFLLWLLQDANFGMDILNAKLEECESVLNHVILDA